MLYKVEGIVIRSMDYGEGNKIITIFTREIGKTAVLARGAKKLKSRHSAASQLFTYAEYTFYASSRGQMGTLQQEEIISTHHRLRENLSMAAYASYLAEMTDRMLPDGEASEAIFTQLLAAFAAIEQDKDAQVIAHLFEMKMLAWTGYMPELDVCAACGREMQISNDAPASGRGHLPRDGKTSVDAQISGSVEMDGGQEEKTVLSIRLGGILCAGCRKRDAAAIPVIGRTVKMLRLFRTLDLRRIGEISVKQETKEELKRCLRAFIDHHVGVQWKSRHFLDQMEKYQL